MRSTEGRTANWLKASRSDSYGLRTFGHRGLTIRRSVFNAESVLLFLLPAMTCFRINLVGQILASDLLVIFTFGIMLIQKKLRIDFPYLKQLMGLFLFWFACTMFSDIVNHTSAANIARGWSKVGLFGLFLLVIFNLIKGQRDRLAIAMFGVAVGNFLTVVLVTSQTIGGPYTGTLWRFGVGFSFTVFFALVLSGFGFNRRSSGFGILVLSPLHLLLSARSLFLRTFVASLFSVMSLKVKSRKGRTAASILLVVILSLGLGVGEAIYGKVVTSGILGQSALQKYEIQSAGGNGSVLLGGRSESLISLTAIADKPILGHGSWANDEKYLTLYWVLLEQRGLQGNFNSNASRIPAHSVLLGSWVENGIGGAIFWGVVTFLAVRAVLEGALGPKPADVLMFLAIVTLLWDIPFSPFGAERRVILPIYIAAVVMVLTDQRRLRKDVLS